MMTHEFKHSNMDPWAARERGNQWKEVEEGWQDSG